MCSTQNTDGWILNNILPNILSAKTYQVILWWKAKDICFLIDVNVISDNRTKHNAFVKIFQLKTSRSELIENTHNDRIYKMKWNLQHKQANENMKITS